MASESGGRADKLGNEFERLWAVQHLVELVAGRAAAVNIECLGDDERGTEFWVTRPDGTREAHQCKRENASEGRWSVAALEAKRVISSAKFHLDRDPSCRFVFVSGDKTPHLSDLCERAAMCESPSEFRAYSVTTSRELLREFRTLCSYLQVDPDEPSGAARALDFLRRFRPLSEDKLTLRGKVEDLAGTWLTGDPVVAVAALKDLVDKSIGLTLRADGVIKALPDAIRPRDLSREPTLHLRLEALRERFDRSYRHLLIGGTVLKRRETEDLWHSITTESEMRAVLLHGPGGEGKSGVVFELVERLRERGLPYLPLRLDRDRPGDTPLDFGRQLELPGSPAACLAAAAAGEHGVLILDQVDAIRWTSAHSSHAWDTCERLITEALRHPNLAVVVVCRSFDVEDDPRLRAWKEQSKAKEVKVGPLDDEVVGPRSRRARRESIGARPSATPSALESSGTVPLDNAS